MSYTQQIVEGVMNRVLYEIGRVVWNATQQSWGPDWNGPFFPLSCGAVKVVMIEDDDYRSLGIESFGHKVETELGSKRNFYYANLPDEWTDFDFVTWAKLVFDELAVFDNVTIDKIMGRPVRIVELTSTQPVKARNEHGISR